MIRIFITCFIALSLGVNAYADVKSSALEKVSSKVSSTVSNLIPGEGLTEVDISYRENLDNNFEINILGVRDILSGENSNLFTQFSLHNQEINKELDRLSIGYRENLPYRARLEIAKTLYQVGVPIFKINSELSVESNDYITEELFEKRVSFAES